MLPSASTFCNDLSRNSEDAINKVRFHKIQPIVLLNRDAQEAEADCESGATKDGVGVPIAERNQGDERGRWRRETTTGENCLEGKAHNDRKPFRA
ncbi:unnamed protein product [Linum trigynum]|uniref:Uncharacterized protein n=1 Tax=Linum trigynum TaxID=586398 RepID=A0AAV2ERB8_9ROSI